MAYKLNVTEHTDELLDNLVIVICFVGSSESVERLALTEFKITK